MSIHVHNIQELNVKREEMRRIFVNLLHLKELRASLFIVERGKKIRKLIIIKKLLKILLMYLERNKR